MALLIFDLDGTLVDSKQDLIDSVNAMLGYMSMPSLPGELIAKLVGRGAVALVRSALGETAPEAEVTRGHEFFLRYYGEHMLDCTRLYAGVKEALDELKERGNTLAVLTNKPERFSLRMMQQLDLGGHFIRVYGGNSFVAKKPDPVGILSLLEETGISRRECVMVGDSAVDVRTARNAQVRACGVTWGFQPETFTADPPDFLIEHPRQLASRIESW